jgi:hypothetical protein
MSTIVSLADAKAFAAFLAPLRNKRWFVYAKRPFAGPKAVLAYLSRYTHRVAISNRRLIALDQRHVIFNPLAPCAPHGARRADFTVEIFRTMWGATIALPFLR